MTKWNRSLGTSKREQGIVTPRQKDILRKRKQDFERGKLLGRESWFDRFWNFLNTDIIDLFHGDVKEIQKKEARKPVIMNKPQPMAVRPRLFRHQSR